VRDKFLMMIAHSITIYSLCKKVPFLSSNFMPTFQA
jgi:hypothetical protein